MSNATPDARLAYLMQNGRRFLTLVYIGGHVVLYIGNYSDLNQPSSMIAMTYQNIWGLRPNSDDRRVIIGQAALLPLLLHYPDDPSLESLVAKRYFQISYLDELPDEHSSALQPAINIKMLIMPEEITY